jgi:hypothetical protein
MLTSSTMPSRNRKRFVIIGSSINLSEWADKTGATR